MPDDEIYSLGTGGDGGLWMAHGMGIVRADLRIPVRTFGYYQGLRGNILSTIEFNDILYVGCSEGLYSLAEKCDYKAVDMTVKLKAQPKVEPQAPKETAPLKGPETIEEKKKGFLTRLFSRRTNREDDDDLLGKTQTETTTSVEEKDLAPIRRTIYQLQSLTHSYNKVNGVQGKVRQLITQNNRLFAATNLGFFEIDGENARYVVKDKNITFALASTFQPETIILGTDEGAYIATKSRGKWIASTILEGEGHLIVSILQLDTDSFLITNEFDVFLATKAEKSNFYLVKIPIPGTEFSNPIVRWVNGEPMAFSSSGAYFFDRETNELIFDVSTSSQTIIVFNQPNYTWVKESREWHCYSASSNLTAINPILISLLDNPNYLHVVNDTTILAVNGYSQVYRISTSEYIARKKFSASSLKIFLMLEATS